MTRDVIIQTLQQHFDITLVDDFAKFAFERAGADWPSLYESEDVLLADMTLFKRAMTLDEQVKSQLNPTTALVAEAVSAALELSENVLPSTSAAAAPATPTPPEQPETGDEE